MESNSVSISASENADHSLASDANMEPILPVLSPMELPCIQRSDLSPEDPKIKEEGGESPNSETAMSQSNVAEAHQNEMTASPSPSSLTEKQESRSEESQEEQRDQDDDADNDAAAEVTPSELSSSSPHPDSSLTSPDDALTALPTFRDPRLCMWTSTYAANSPSEDRSSSLVNVLLRPNDDKHHALIRLSLWSVIDGHGGGIVATYASEVLLPHIAASVSRALDCEIVDRGVCAVNGELRDANAMDLDKLILSSSRSNPFSIHYRSPRDESDDKEGEEMSVNESKAASAGRDTTTEETEFSLASSLKPREDVDLSMSSASTSVKTAASQEVRGDLVGMHSPDEVARVTRAITDSFLAVDEGWINSVDPLTTRQKSCQSNGQWNAGACALVAFTLQRLEWSSSPAVESPFTTTEGLSTKQETPDNNEAARLDFTTKDKSTSSVNTISPVPCDAKEATLDSEMTETEDEDDDPPAITGPPSPAKDVSGRCPRYQPREAMLYCAHVGDCRAVMLSTAPPRTISVPPDAAENDQKDINLDDSSYQSSDETECTSSSDFDAASSDEEDHRGYDTISPVVRPFSSYMRHPSKRQYAFRAPPHAPFVPLPPIPREKRMTGGAPLSLAPLMRPVDLTTDHSAYNPAEVRAVLRRCNNAPKAITSGVIPRVAGTLAVTRALGDAYLKTPLLSFPPFKSAAPYITAQPEVNCRLLTKSSDLVLCLGSDGIWDQASGDDILRWVRNYTDERGAQVERRKKRKTERGLVVEAGVGDGMDMLESDIGGGSSPSSSCELRTTPSPKRKRTRSSKSNVADVIIRRVLNKVRRARKFTSVKKLMSLPPGRARRSRHDDMTAVVIEMNSFVS